MHATGLGLAVPGLAHAVVDLAVAVVVLAVAGLGGRGRCAAAFPCTRIARLDAGAARIRAVAREVFVDLAVAIVVDAIALLVGGDRAGDRVERGDELGRVVDLEVAIVRGRRILAPCIAAGALPGHPASP